MVMFHSFCVCLPGRVHVMIVKRFIPVDHANLDWKHHLTGNVARKYGTYDGRTKNKNGDFVYKYIYIYIHIYIHIVFEWNIFSNIQEKKWSYVIYIYIHIYIYTHVNILMMCSFSHILLLFHPRNPWNQWFPMAKWRQRSDSSLRGIPSAPSARLGRPMKLWIWQPWLWYNVGPPFSIAKLVRL